MYAVSPNSVMKKVSVSFFLENRNATSSLWHIFGDGFRVKRARNPSYVFLQLCLLALHLDGRTNVGPRKDSAVKRAQFRAPSQKTTVSCLGFKEGACPLSPF